MKRILLYLLFLLAFGWFSLAGAQLVPGQLIIKFKPGIVKIPQGISASSVRTAQVSTASVKALDVKYQVAEFELMYKDALSILPDWRELQDVYVLKFPAEKNVKAAAADYRRDANVLYASPNSIVHAFDVTPNDPYFPQQWYLSKIKLPQAWAKGTGSSGSLMAMLDTGVNLTQEDLSPKLDLTYARNFTNSPETTDVSDDNGHGSATAAVAAAATNNSLGIAGVDWQGRILPLKVLKNDGTGTMSDVSRALAWLTALKKNGVNVAVANMSLGQYNVGDNKYVEQDFAQIKERCQDAYDAGIVLVAAAGNGGVDWNSYPAYYPTVVAVAATDQDDKRSVWLDVDGETGKVQSSNYGDWVDVSAPGTTIISTALNGGYASWNGTSLASPVVTGLVSLLRAANAQAGVAAVVSQLKGTADNIDSLNPNYKLGTGRINAFKALVAPTAVISYPTSDEGQKYVKGRIEVLGTAEGWNFGRYVLEAINSGVATLESRTSTVSGGILGTWETAGLNGDFTLHLKVTGTDKTSTETSVPVVADNISPEVAITSPADGDTLDGKATINGKAKDLNFYKYVLEYGEGANPSTYNNIGAYFLAVENGVLGTWEMSGLKGSYSIRLTAADKAGNSSSIKVSVVLSGQQPPTKEVEAMGSLPPTFVLPNPFDRRTTAETSFVYSLKGNFDSTLYLFDLNGNLIWRRVFSAGANGGKAGLNNPAWDGRSLFGERVDAGVYIFQVTTDRKIIARGKIIVLN